MTDTDPELQEILRKKAAVLKETATFFSKINSNGVNHVDDSNIGETIGSSPIPVLVDFSADSWCRPCQVMSPIYEELSHEYANRVLFLKINTDHNPKSSAEYRIFSVPTFVIFNKGNRVAHRTGATPKVKFKTWMEEVIKKIR
jgi:thioredoxin